MRSYSEQFINLLSNVFAGSYVYSTQLEVYDIISFAYLLVAFFAILTEKEKNKLSTISKVFVGCIGIIVIALISTAIYMQCTANFIGVDNPVIVGLQGRYFIPIFILGLLIFQNYNLKINTKNLIAISVFLNLPIYLTMIVRFML